MATEDLEDVVRARLRQRRFERGLSLGDVAAATGMSRSALSRLETGARRLTLAHVARLAAALGVTPGELVAAGDGPGALRRSHDGRTWRAVGPERTSGARVYRVGVPVQEDGPSEMHGHEGHQWLYVLRGTVRLRIEDREVVLAEGEAAAFSTWRPHALGAVGEPAEALVVFSPDGHPLRTAQP